MELVLDHVMGLIAAIVVVLCQWSLGSTLANRFSKTPLSCASHWLIGLSAFAIVQMVLLLLGFHDLIWGSLLLLPYALLRLKKKDKAEFKNFSVAIMVILLLSPFLFRFIEDWDTGFMYMYNARRWAETGSFSFDTLLSFYGCRPQIVSTLYSWNFMLGGEKACQYYDLFFYAAMMLSLANLFSFSKRHVLAVLLFFALCKTMGYNSYLYLAGTAGNDIFMCFFMLGCYELLIVKRVPVILMTIVLTVLFLIRWNCCFIYFVVWIFAVLDKHYNKRELVALLIMPLLLSCWWHIYFTVQRGGNPVFPGLIDVFGGQPVNEILRMDHTSDWNHFKKFMGLRRWEHVVYFANFNLIAFSLFVLSVILFFMRKIKEDYRRILIFSWACLVITSLITNQWRFQVLSVMICVSVFIRHMGVVFERKGLFKKGGLILVAFLIVSIVVVPSLRNKIHNKLSDITFDKQELLSKRINLYQAMKWLNENAPSKEGVVFINLPNYYYCEVNAVKGSEAVFMMPDDVWKDPLKASAFLKDLSVKYIVIEDHSQNTLDKYRYLIQPENMKQLAVRGEIYADKISRDVVAADKDWQLVKQIPRSYRWNSAKIYQLKP